MTNQILANVQSMKNRNKESVPPSYTSDVLLEIHTLIQTNEQKLYWIYEALEQSLIQKNDYLLARFTRTFLEHLSIYPNLQKALNATINSKNLIASKEKALEAMTKRARNIFYNTHFYKAFRQKNNFELIKITKFLSITYEHAKKDYNFLSDFVHPYFGSNLIMMDEDFMYGHEYDLNKRNEAIARIKSILENLMELHTYYLNTLEVTMLEMEHLNAV